MYICMSGIYNTAEQVYFEQYLLLSYILKANSALNESVSLNYSNEFKKFNATKFILLTF
jgi:hypothetical protein